MLYLCFTPASRLLIYLTTVILLYLHICSYTPTFLILYSHFFWCVRVCVCRLTGLVECVEESRYTNLLMSLYSSSSLLRRPIHACGNVSGLRRR